MLGVFLLPAFTRLGHEREDLLSPCGGMHVCTDYTSVYTLIRKSFGLVESEAMLTPREKSPLPEKSPLRRMEPTTLHQAGQRAQHHQRAIPAHSYWYDSTRRPSPAVSGRTPPKGAMEAVQTSGYITVVTRV